MIESQENKIRYAVGTGKEYSFPIRFLKAEDIRCHVGTSDEITELVPGADFTVLPKSDYSSGGIVQINKTLPVGKTLVISRVCDLKQDLSLPEHGKLPSSGIETALDKVFMICQQMMEVISRCLKVTPTDDKTPEDTVKLFMNAQLVASDQAARAEKAANDALVNGESQVQKAKYWAERAKEEVVRGEVGYEALGTTVIITPDTVTPEDDIEYEEV